MKKTLALALFVLTAAHGIAQTSYTVDPAAAKMLWKGKKITGQHSGTIHVKSGTINWNEQGLADATVDMDMTTIAVTGMSPESAAELEGDLRSSAFFNTEAFKTATFKTTTISPIAGAEAGKPNYNVTGDLTIKGITHPVTFAVLAWKDGNAVRAAGTLLFDRTWFDIKFRSGKFYDGLGDKMIEDMVELTFDVTGK